METKSTCTVSCLHKLHKINSLKFKHLATCYSLHQNYIRAWYLSIIVIIPLILLQCGNNLSSALRIYSKKCTHLIWLWGEEQLPEIWNKKRNKNKQVATFNKPLTSGTWCSCKAFVNNPLFIWSIMKKKRHFENLFLQ